MLTHRCQYSLPFHRQTGTTCTETHLDRSTGKVIDIDRRLEQIDRIVNGLVGASESRSSVEEASSRRSDGASPSPAQPSLRRVRQGEATSSPRSQTQQSFSSHSIVDTPSEGTREGSHLVIREDATSQVEAEGPSSLTAHSNFAADYIKRAANWDEGDESGNNARGLLDTMRQMVGTIEKQHRLPENRLPARTITPLPPRRERNLPPFEVAATVIRKARGIKFPISIHFGHHAAGYELNPTTSPLCPLSPFMETTLHLLLAC